MYYKTILKIVLFAVALSTAACQKPGQVSTSISPSALRDVPALRLNFRFEADVPPPEAGSSAQIAEERNSLVQADFDQNRPQDILDFTATSPDKQRVLAIYHTVSDVPDEYRLEMYGIDGRSIKQITPDGMAVHFPESIVWSPDSSSIAFVGMVRLAKLSGLIPEKDEGKSSESVPQTVETDQSANTNEAGAGDPAAEPPVSGVAPVLTFRTEQIYLCDSNGNGLKPLTQQEGLIYFYFAWSPDSSSLAALAAKATEWKIFQYQAAQKGEIFKPSGRPRIVEKTGRLRLLDDYPTDVHPVWSPDSAKIAAAFDRQIRIYDAIGNAPTQAAILLRNQLLISSKAYDELNKPEAAENTNSNSPVANSAAANKTPAAPLPEGVLPDESTLVSFNPITQLFWAEDSMLYFETAYVKTYLESANNVRSNSRWHRLIFSPQAVAIGN